jgi:hypothetical protein
MSEQSDKARERFEALAKRFFSDPESPEALFWKLQTLARDAVMSLDYSDAGSSVGGYLDLITIAQAFLNGAAASLILNKQEGWSVGAATGKNAASLVGALVDPNEPSISSEVIKNRRPYFFVKVKELSGLKKRSEESERYQTEYFCSFPVSDSDGELIGILNVADMGEEHPLFTAERDAIDGFIQAIGIQVKMILQRELRTR